MKTLLRSAVLLAALPLAACDSDSTGSSRYEGSTGFQYSGAFSGTFRADGNALTSSFETGSYAFGQAGSDPVEGDYLFLLAQHDGPGTLVDNLLLSVEQPALGTVTCSATTEDCPINAILVLGDDGAREDDDAQALLFSSSGSVTITSLTERRARGTFQFILSDLFGEAGSEVRVTSGTFDIPLVDSDDTGFSRAAASRALLNRSR